MEKQQSLEADQHLYNNANELSWEQKMALLYRIEKKRIIRNQIDLLAYFRRIITVCIAPESCTDEEFRELILKETSEEEFKMGGATAINDPELRKIKQTKCEDQYWFKRLINSDYIRELFMFRSQSN